MRMPTMLVLFAICSFAVSGQTLSTSEVRESLRGEKLKVPNYSEITPIEWTFDKEELIELDIVEQGTVGQTTTVVANIKTTDAAHRIRFTTTQRGREYFPTPVLEGRLRLTYVRGSLRSIDNLSVKYRFVQPEIFDNTTEIARMNPQAPPGPPVAQNPFPVVNSTFSMPGGSWRWFNFTLNSNARVSGSFVAHDNSSIQGLVMTEMEFINWRNNNQNLAYYRSGNVTFGSVNVTLPPGRYVFVVYNQALLSAKTVTASVFVQ